MHARTVILGLHGPAGSGKSTLARHLAENAGFVVIPFADPMKQALKQLQVPDANLWGTQEQKDQPLALLNGKSARQALQLLGTEWGRNLIGNDFWVNVWRAKASKYQRVVVDDVRFDNEADVIHDMGGLVVDVRRPGHVGTAHSSHSSERGINPINLDIALTNNAGLAKLTAQVDHLVSAFFDIGDVQMNILPAE